MNKTKLLRDSIDASINVRLKSLSKYFYSLDNKQKDYPIKFQQCGHSNKHMKVTSTVSIKHKHAISQVHNINGKSSLTYSKHVTLSPFLMLHF